MLGIFADIVEAMNMSETDYKYLLAALITLSGVIRSIYELRHRGIERVVAYYEGRERFFVRWVGLFLTGPALVYLFSSWLDFASFHLDDRLRLAAAWLMLLNILFFLWIHIALGMNWSPILEIRKEQSLVTTGPYKYIRHPMYTSIFVHCILMWALTANHIVGLSGLLAFGSIYPFRVRTEEEMMTDEFGDRYKAYMRRTGRLLPKLF